MSLAFSAAIPLGVLLASMGVFYLAVEFTKWRRKSKERSSPLNRMHLRAPGESLLEELEKQRSEAMVWLVVVLVIPLLLYAGHVTGSHYFGIPDSLDRILVSLILSIGVVVYAVSKFLAQARRVKRLGLGFAAERTTGEELNALMLAGCRVYYDVPFDHGNIDHVVVAPTGIFAVETKSRTKPNSDDNYSIQVDHERQLLRFPDYSEKIPTRQLDSQRNWLKKFVAEVTDDTPPVISVLSFPGWLIDRKNSGPLLVMNPRQPAAFLLKKRPNVVSDETMRLISLALENRVRNVTPYGRQPHVHP